MHRPSSPGVAALLALTTCLSSPLLAQTVPEGPPPAGQTATPSPPTPAPEQGTVIRSIAVAGAQRLEPETIVSYIQLRPGDVYTPARADQALIDLAATELFADSTIALNDATGAVVVTVEENPMINRIILEGNRRVDDDKILPEINLAARQIFTRSKVRADVARIIELYKRQGRFAASVEPQMVMLDQNRVDLVFQITEGPKSKVRKINIIGNSVFSDAELGDQMVTKPALLRNIMSSSTSYDPDRLAFDQQKLRQFYLTQGYADFRVISAVAELTPDKRDFIITYVVEEGERYKFGKVEVVSQLRDFSSELLTASIRVREGNWYDAQLVDDTIESLTETAGTFGYAFADVRPDIQLDRETLTMAVTFTVADAPRVYVEAIDINGNTITQDKVVRREFRVAEGDAFSSLQIQRSTARINSLGYFQENFEIDQIEGASPDRIRLIANLQERPTGELSLSAGYSSTESFVFQGSIKQNNFRGRGQSVGLSASLSGSSRSLGVSFTEPNFLDRNISLGLDLYRQESDNSYYSSDDAATYEQTTTGFSARVGIPLSEYLAVIGSYTLNFQDLMLDENSYFADLDGDGTRTCEPLLAGRYLCDAVGNTISSIVGASLSYGNLDSNYRPTRGTRWSLTGQIAGLGGDSRFLRLSAKGDRFWNLGSGLLLTAHGEAGYMHNLDSGETRFTDRFFLGEPSLKGFDIRGIGPAVERTYLVSDSDGDAEASSVTREAVGGNAYYLGRLELELPLGSGVRELGIRPSLFVNVGSVFGLSEPALSQSPFPDGSFIATTDDDGNALFTQTADANGDGVTETTYTTSRYAPDGTENSAVGTTVSPFTEAYVGNTWKPRIAVGLGVNWNSPMGPFRFDLSHVIAKQPGDDTKIFSFNVGTQF